MLRIIRGSGRLAIRKILVANRSEIAIRVFRAANELGLKTVAIYAEQDKLALHRFKADEAYQVGKGLGPIEAYLSIDEIIRVAKHSNADAIHPGYGLLSESPEFVDACETAGITFIGPKSETMRRLGNKVAARNLAIEAGVPVMPATDPLPDDLNEIKKQALEIGYPVMLKASWGGGGRGMRVIPDEATLEKEVLAAKREAKAAFGKDEIYLEKLVQRARHVEVQILGDGETVVHLFERDCSIQRRHQKVVERAPAPYLDEAKRAELCEYGLKIGRAVNYRGGGHCRVLDGCRHGRDLLHRGQPSGPGRAHGDRRSHRHRYRPGTDPHRRWRKDRNAGKRCAGAGEHPPLTVMRCNAGSPRKIRSRISFRIMAASPRIAARPVSVFVSMAGPPIQGR